MRAILLVGMTVMMSLLTLSCAHGRSPTSLTAYQKEVPLNNEDVLIYVYRLRSMVGAAGGWSVRLDDKEIGVLRNGTYLTVHTTPGTHVVLVGGDPTYGVITAATMGLNTHAMTGGNAYYYRAAGFKAYFVDEEAAMKELPRLKCVNCTQGMLEKKTTEHAEAANVPLETTPAPSPQWQFTTKVNPEDNTTRRRFTLQEGRAGIELECWDPHNPKFWGRVFLITVPPASVMGGVNSPTIVFQLDDESPFSKTGKGIVPSTNTVLFDLTQMEDDWKELLPRILKAKRLRLTVSIDGDKVSGADRVTIIMEFHPYGIDMEKIREACNLSGWQTASMDTTVPTESAATVAPAQTTCAEMSCAGHGKCVMKGGKPMCACDDGYIPDTMTGLSCQPYE